MGLYKRMKRMLCYGSTKRIAARKEKSEKIRETYMSLDLDIRHHILGPGTVRSGSLSPENGLSDAAGRTLPAPLATNIGGHIGGHISPAV